MIIKCPNCNGALEYNVEKGLMYCKFCDSYFTAEEIAMPETNPVDEEVSAVAAQEYTNPAPEQFNANNNTMSQGVQPKPSFNSLDDISNSAAVAREAGMTGGLVYNYTSDERNANRNAYYEQQQRLHEEFIKPHKVDYTKPYISKADAADDKISPAEMAMASLAAGNTGSVDRRKQYYEEQQRLHEEYSKRPPLDLTKPFSGTTREGKTAEQIREMEMKEMQMRQRENGVDPRMAAAQSAFDFHGYYQQNPDMHAQHIDAQMGRGRYRYTPGGARIINDVKMLVTTDTPPEDGSAKIDHKVYTCTSCGAELSLTGVETSSFCAYCGQPTIVYNRMESTLMPDSIIPFVITRDQALKLVRTRLNKGFFIPKEVQNFEVERLNGIYIPYWLFDASYDDSMIIRSRVKQGKTTVTKYYRVNTGCNLFYFPVDASRSSNDNSSRKLEPYDYAGIRPFNVSYMSGFYSDRFDMPADTMMMTSMYRAQNMMYEKAKKKVPGSPTGLADSHPVYHVRKKYYVLLPAWFMTFRYEGVPYTIMVNGQTGKVVGAVPYSKKKFFGLFGAIFALLSLILVPIMIAISKAVFISPSKSDGGYKLIIMLFMIVGVLFVSGSTIMKKYKKNMDLTTETKLNKFTNERQEI